MKTKLTLTVEKDIVEEAKQYAKATGVSLSELIQNYLKRITASTKNTEFNEPSSKYTKYSGIIECDWDPFEDRDKFRDARIEKYTK
jgi:hypothetical protein